MSSLNLFGLLFIRNKNWYDKDIYNAFILKRGVYVEKKEALEFT